MRKILLCLLILGGAPVWAQFANRPVCFASIFTGAASGPLGGKALRAYSQRVLEQQGVKIATRTPAACADDPKLTPLFVIVQAPEGVVGQRFITLVSPNYKGSLLVPADETKAAYGAMLRHFAKRWLEQNPPQN